MAKLTLNALGNLNNPTSAVSSINDNYDSIETALENTLSRDGTSPNTMGASLDMNSNKIINLAAPTANSDAARLVDVQNSVESITELNADLLLAIDVDKPTELVTVSTVDATDTALAFFKAEGQSDNTTLWGSSQGFDTASPTFQVEDTGRGKVRMRSWINFDPGDTAEGANYSSQGSPGAVRPGGISSSGTNEVGQNTVWFGHLTQYAWDDDHDWTAVSTTVDTANTVLSNTYRTIKPYRLSGGPNFDITVYGGPTDPTEEDNGKALCLYFTESSGTAPTLEVNASGVQRAIKLSTGATPAANLWVAGKEIIVEWNSGASEWRCRADSDTSAGYTARDAFSNPNYGRAMTFGARMREAPQETSRPVNPYIAVARPGELVPRDAFVISDIGCIVGMGHASYETGPAVDGFDPVYNYPGDMESTGTDPMWTGNEFAGNHNLNAFNVSGWGALSGFSSPEMPGLATRNITDQRYGIDIGYSEASSYGYIAGVTPGASGTAQTITAVDDLEGRVASMNIGIPVCTVANHGYGRPTFVHITGATGCTEINGSQVIWPIDKDRFKVLGVRYSGTALGGTPTVTKVDRTPLITFSQSDDVYLGGTPSSATLFLDANTSAAANGIRITPVNTGNAPTIQPQGGDANISIQLASKGTGIIRLMPGNLDGLRINYTASAVNYGVVIPSATGNVVTYSVGGSDANISTRINTKGSGSMFLQTNSLDNILLNNVSSAVNYLSFSPSATGNNILFTAAGTDSDVGISIRPKGSDYVFFGDDKADYLKTQGATGTLDLTAEGSSSDITIRAVPKGTGSLSVPAAIFSSSSSGGVGYTTGAGGTVTQATSKSTGVEINTMSGEITMNNASLNAATIVTFTVTNANALATDVIVLNHRTTGTLGAYTLNAAPANGSFDINVRNNTGGALGEAIVIRYAIIRGSNS